VSAEAYTSFLLFTCANTDIHLKNAEQIWHSQINQTYDCALFSHHQGTKSANHPNLIPRTRYPIIYGNQQRRTRYQTGLEAGAQSSKK